MSLNTMNLVLLGVTFSAAYGLPLLQPTCPGILNYSPMPQITALNSESVNQVLSKMRLLGQAMEVLTTVIMCDAQGSSKPITCLPTPQHPCYSGVESSLSDNLNVRYHACMRFARYCIYALHEYIETAACMHR